MSQHAIVPVAGRQKPSAAALAHLSTVQGRRHNDALVIESLRGLKARLNHGGEAEYETVDWEQARESSLAKERRHWFVT